MEMREHKKIYSNILYADAIKGVENKLLQHGDYKIQLEKQDNDLYELRLYKNDTCYFIVVNTIDCLYSLVSGYQKALYDNNIIK